TLPDIATRRLVLAGLAAGATHDLQLTSSFAPGAPARRWAAAAHDAGGVATGGGQKKSRPPAGRGRAGPGGRPRARARGGTGGPAGAGPGGGGAGAGAAGAPPPAPGAPAAPPPPMPAITKPISFDTPEADAVLAALQVFPPDNWWNRDVSALPVHRDSAKMIA